MSEREPHDEVRPPADERVRVVALEALDDHHCRLTLEAGNCAGFRPGQFAMLRVGEPLLLRRPFSIQRGLERDGEACIEILFRVVGRGTAVLAELAPGDEVQILGPLGTPFPMPAEGELPVLLGGGVGIPPVVAMARALLAAGGRESLVVGGITRASDHACLEGLLALPKTIHVASMDGSEGFRGTVLDLLDDLWSGGPPERTHLYACGPLPMLAAVAKRAEEWGVSCHVSVEAVMGCGIGVCVGCAVPRHAVGGGPNRFALACQEGPVFDSRELDFRDLHGWG